ncbi:hypothetical protein KC717_01850, partial [Candidatus Dojkabacteria bacterium]|nr:hypothetical protein [Candidatus Dojkabacteria bacterium]
YIVFEKNNEVHIIDQHAADERIHFERIQKDMSEKKMITRQDLLLPITLEYSQDEIAIITEHIEDLLQFGLDIDIFGKKSIKINAIPHFAREIHYKDLLNEIISTYKEREELSIDKIQESIAASLACHGSIRAGKHLTDSEIQKLIKDLFDCDLPYSCPHGRPIIWTLQRKDFEKKFERIKPS